MDTKNKEETPQTLSRAKIHEIKFIGNGKFDAIASYGKISRIITNIIGIFYIFIYTKIKKD